MSDLQNGEHLFVSYITEELIRKASKSENAKDIKTLDLHYRRESKQKIKFIEKLDACINLTVLDLSGNSVGKIDNLSKLLHLQELNLADNLITKIENLSFLSRLKVLNLNGNKIQRIPSQSSSSGAPSRPATPPTSVKSPSTASNVEILPQSLQTLRLARNQLFVLRDVEHLSTLKNLTVVEVNDNPIYELAHYRPFTIFHLQTIEVLDGNAVTVDDRRLARERFSREEIEELQRKLQRWQDDHQQLQNKSNNTQKELKDAKSTIKNLEQATEELRQQILSQQEEINTKTKMKTSELSNMNELVVDLQKELDNYKFEHGERIPANAVPSHNRNKAGALRAQLETAEMQMSDLMHQLEIATDKYKESMGSCDSCTAEIVSEEMRMADLIKELRAIAFLPKLPLAEAANVKKYVLGEQIKQGDRLKDLALFLQQSGERIELDIKQAENERDSLGNDLDESQLIPHIQATIDAMQKDIQRKSSKRTEILKILDGIVTSSKDIQASLAREEEPPAAADAEERLGVMTALTDVAKIQKLISSLTDLLDNLYQQFMSQTDTAKLCDEQRNEIEEQLGVIDAEKQALEAKMKQDESVHFGTSPSDDLRDDSFPQQGANPEIQKLNETIEKLTSQLQKYQRDNTYLMNDTSLNLEKSLAAAAKQQELEKQIELLQTMLEAKDERLKAFENKVHENANLKQQLLGLDKILRDQQSEISELKHMIESQELAQRQDMNKQLTDVQTKLKKGLEEYHECLHQIQARRDEKSRVEKEILEMQQHLEKQRQQIDISSELNKSAEVEFNELELSIHKLEDLHEKNRKHLQDQLDFAEQEIGKNKVQIDNLYAQKKTIMMEIQELKQEQLSLKQDEEQLQEINESLMNKNTLLQEKADDLQSQIKQLENTMAELAAVQKQQKEHSEKVESLKKDIEDLTVQRDAMVSSLDKMHEEGEQDLGELESQRMGMLKEVQKLKREETALKQKHKNLASDIEDMHQQGSMLQREIQEMQDALGNIQAQHEKVTNELIAIRQEKHKLLQQEDALQKNLHTLQGTVEEINQQLIIKAQNEAQIAELTEKRNHLVKEIHQLKQDETQQKQAINRISLESEKLELVTAEYQDQIDILRKELNDLRTQKSNLGKNVATLKQEEQFLKQHAGQLKSEAEIQQSVLSEIRKQYAIVATQIQQLEEQRTSLAPEVARLVHEENIARPKLQQLLEKMAQLESTVSSLQGQGSREQDQIAKLNEQREKLADSMQKIYTEKQKFEQQKDQLDSQIQTLQRNNDQLNQELRDKQEVLDHVKELRSHRESLQQEISQLKQDEQKLKHKQQNQTSEINFLQAQHAQLQDQITQMNKQRDSLALEVGSLEKDLDQCRQDRTKLMSQLQELTRQYQSLQQQMHQESPRSGLFQSRSQAPSGYRSSPSAAEKEIAQLRQLNAQMEHELSKSYSLLQDKRDELIQMEERLQSVENLKGKDQNLIRELYQQTNQLQQELATMHTSRVSEPPSLNNSFSSPAFTFQPTTTNKSSSWNRDKDNDSLSNASQHTSQHLLNEIIQKKNELIERVQQEMKELRLFINSLPDESAPMDLKSSFGSVPHIDHKMLMDQLEDALTEIRTQEQRTLQELRKKDQHIQELLQQLQLFRSTIETYKDINHDLKDHLKMKDSLAQMSFSRDLDRSRKSRNSKKSWSNEDYGGVEPSAEVPERYSDNRYQVVSKEAFEDLVNRMRQPRSQ